MKRFWRCAAAAALMLGVTAFVWVANFAGRCPGKCPLCP